MIDIDSPAWNLSGMEYRGFVHSPEYWRNLTGVDPSDYPMWFVVRNGLVGCTQEFIKAYRLRASAVRSNWNSLGFNN